jgi:PAS domain S-box-containing protein
MPKTLRILIIEDVESDAGLVLRQLDKSGYALEWRRVDEAGEMLSALQEAKWDAVIADYRLPCFDAQGALEMLRDSGLDLPFIVVSGTIGEETAAALMKAGAHDYVMKGNLARLTPVLERELKEAEVRRQSRIDRKKLAEDEKKFRLMYENSPLGYQSLDRKGCLLEVNPAWLGLIGYADKSEVLGRNFEYFLVKPEEFEERFSRFLETGEIRGCEIEMRRADGTVFWAMFDGKVQLDRNGGFVQTHCIFSDITERKRMEEQLIRDEQEQRAFSQSLVFLTNELSKTPSLDELCRMAVTAARDVLKFDRAGLWFFDADFRKLRGSFGIDEKGGLRDERGSVMPVTHQDVESILYEKKPVVIVREQELFDDHGTVVGQGFHATAGLWNGEEVIGYLSVDNLLSRKSIGMKESRHLSLYAASLGSLCTLKKTEGSLMEGQANFSAIAGNAYDGILISLGARSHAYANARASEITGFSNEELLKTGFSELVREDSRPKIRRSKGKLRKEDRVPLRFEVLLARKDGSSIPVELSVTPTLWKGKQAQLIFLNDISERKKFERRIEADIREKDVLLKEIHHRVKNNLQIIVSLLNLQSDKTKNARVHAAFDEIRNRIFTMALLHEKLYMSESFAEVPFKAYLTELCRELLGSSGADDHIDIDFDLTDIHLGIDAAVPCGLIVNEIVTNAIKHAFPAGRKGKIAVTFRRNGTGWNELRIKDDGVGLPPGFDAVKTQSLGLTIIRILAQQLEGDLTVSSGKGTSYRLVFSETEKAVEHAKTT